MIVLLSGEGGGGDWNIIVSSIWNLTQILISKFIWMEMEIEKEKMKEWNYSIVVKRDWALFL